MMTRLPAIVQIVGIWLAAAATMLYLYSLPDTDLIIKLIGFVPVLGLAVWLSLKFWR
jgi:branched-subunit amino acid transport protein AzlD